jgi:hypothetical protein
MRDERTVAVENASYRLGYLFLSFALLLDVMFRSFARREAPWDLMALIVAGGVVCSVYQARRRILTHGWVAKVVFAACVAAAVAAVASLAF